MASDELLSRIDEHMARGNEHMARGNEHMARGNELMQQIRAEFELNRKAYEEGLQITRELMRRNELAFQENSRIVSELVEAVRELGAETKAQTRAIFRMLDRFDGGPEPAGA